MRTIEAAKTLLSNRVDRIFIYSVFCLCLACFLIGWMAFGWIIYPVKYVPGGPGTMSQEQQALYVEMAAEWYSYKLNDSQAQILLRDWGGDRLACRMAANTNDIERRVRYQALAWAVNETGCSN